MASVRLNKRILNAEHVWSSVYSCQILYNKLWQPWIQTQSLSCRSFPVTVWNPSPLTWCTLAGILCSGCLVSLVVRGWLFAHHFHQAMFHHQQGVWQFNSIPTLSGDSRFHGFRARSYGTAPFRCQLQAQAVGCAFTNWVQIGGSNNPLQLRMPIQNPGRYLSFWLGCISEVPKTPFLGSINLQEWLTQLRRNILLMRLLVYYKRIEFITPR